MTVVSADQIKDRIYRSDISSDGRLFIVPAPKHSEIKDASVDLRLGNYFIVTKTARFGVLAAREKLSNRTIASYQERVFVPFNSELVLHPGTFVLGVTLQYLGLPNDLSGQVLARSTWGRVGLTVATATTVHPRFCGCLTLELVNNGNAPITLYPGSRIAQLVLMSADVGGDATQVRMSKYCGMIEPSFSKLHEEYDELLSWKAIGEIASLQDIE